jgi:hypothetical protein
MQQVGARLAQEIGGCLAGLNGGLLVEFIGVWGPASWLLRPGW